MFFFFFSSRRRHTRWPRDWSSDVCSSDLFSGEQGLQEWTAIGRIVLTNWQKVIDDLDAQVRIVPSTEFNEDTVTSAASKISTAKQAAQEKREQLEQQRKEEKQAADHYDGSAWEADCIEPVKKIGRASCR